ncbi:phosphopentomutase [Enterovibrio sp. ZSDZ35]|uniref:Phosphopentomutase n=1 Tax=Enterovibrio qingdaonensis TaxID=2899818 RepID=A0ABT5QHT7_9GAMM|nr:phosphopentomutase [Enterovibrio sp. ZSDZ35]MDD1780550.1 phosphopentomutase [Enterovibrio sp. ZSDZ35]
MSKFIVVVLDGFGIGEMPDVAEVRPQDRGANTAAKLVSYFSEEKLPTLESLGLMNVLKGTNSVMKPNLSANWGKAKLAHEGCDTFMGHQEIMGTRPEPPLVMPFNASLDSIFEALITQSYKVDKIERDGLFLLLVNDALIVGDNLEADLGQVYNLTANFNLISFDEAKRIGRVVRNANSVSRNIVFGGFVEGLSSLLSAIEVKNDSAGRAKYIGVNAPKSGVYQKGFEVEHLGYGVDERTQVPYQLRRLGIPTYLYGKVADIVQNEQGTSYKSVVDTETVFSLLVRDLSSTQTGFFCANIQETDLSGHEQDPTRYWNVLEIADLGLEHVISTMEKGDCLVVIADHGNDPFIGHSKHTREVVPVLVYQQGRRGERLGVLDTLADIGASAAEFFGARLPQFGEATILNKQYNECVVSNS